MQDLVQAMAAAADSGTAEVLARYFQVRPGGYGEGDIFLGIKLSALRGMTAAYAAEPFVADRWLTLLRSPVHEHRLAALVVMAERARRGTLRRGDPAELEVGDGHDLVHKAVGWSLREAGKRAPAALREFLDRHLDELPRTGLRYAIEHFPEPERRAYLSR